MAYSTSAKVCFFSQNQYHPCRQETLCPKSTILQTVRLEVKNCRLRSPSCPGGGGYRDLVLVDIAVVVANVARINFRFILTGQACAFSSYSGAARTWIYLLVPQLWWLSCVPC